VVQAIWSLVPLLVFSFISNYASSIKPFMVFFTKFRFFGFLHEKDRKEIFLKTGMFP
jgi:hypothetical protein